MKGTASQLTLTKDGGVLTNRKDKTMIIYGAVLETKIMNQSIKTSCSNLPSLSQAEEWLRNEIHKERKLRHKITDHYLTKKEI